MYLNSYAVSRDLVTVPHYPSSGPYSPFPVLVSCFSSLASIDATTFSNNFLPGIRLAEISEGIISFGMEITFAGLYKLYCYCY
jgi:hypothetical protein